MSNILTTLQNININNITDNLSIENIKENFGVIQSKISSLRPPQEFFDVRHFSKPSNFTELQQRVTYNLNYYQSNYVAIVLSLSLYALITNLLLLFVIALVGGGVLAISKLGGEDLVTPMGRFSSSQLYTGLLIVALPLAFIASPISTMMWLIGSSCVSILSHASFMEKPIETVFEETV
ncbi:unnamed protein product [Pichia kudriavzevii]